MELLEFIEKYRVSNFETYLKDDASIQYWQNLIIEFTKDKNELNNTDIFFYRELKRPNETVFGISFGNFCREQIELIEIKNKFNLTTQEPTEYNKDHLQYFNPKGFELWDKLYEEFIFKKGQKRSADLDFIFQVLLDNNYIKKGTNRNKFTVWLNELNNTEFEKISFYYLNGTEKPNIIRMKKYNEIKNCM
jgi:hypothetical protein